MGSASRRPVDVSLRILLLTVLVALSTLLLLVAFSQLAIASTHGQSHEPAHQHGPAPSASPSVSPPGEHAGHGDGHGDGQVHAPTPVEPADDRPRAAVLGGFAALNGAVIVAAGIARYRRPRRSRR